MPQHAKRVRISRKSLRQPDEFQTIAGSALTWAEQHVRELLVAAWLLVALGVVVVAAARYRTSREAAAAAAFQGARALLEAGKLPEAEKAFADLRRDYGTTSFGRLAPLYQGHALARATSRGLRPRTKISSPARRPPTTCARRPSMPSGTQRRPAATRRAPSTRTRGRVRSTGRSALTRSSASLASTKPRAGQRMRRRSTASSSPRRRTPRSPSSCARRSPPRPRSSRRLASEARAPVNV